MLHNDKLSGHKKGFNPKRRARELRDSVGVKGVGKRASKF